MDEETQRELRIQFAQRLRDLIKAEPGPNRLERLSKKTDITPAKLSEWQNPKHTEWPSMKNFVKLLSAFGVSADYLLYGKSNGDQSISELLKDVHEGFEEIKQAIHDLPRGPVAKQVELGQVSRGTLTWQEILERIRERGETQRALAWRWRATEGGVSRFLRGQLHSPR